MVMSARAYQCVDLQLPGEMEADIIFTASLFTTGTVCCCVCECCCVVCCVVCVVLCVVVLCVCCVLLCCVCVVCVHVCVSVTGDMCSCHLII